MIRPDEQFAIVGTVDPDANAAGTANSDWVDMKDFEYLVAIYMLGTLGALATIDGNLQQATDSSGSGAKAFSPAKAITQLTQAGTDDDKQVILIARQDELDVAGGFDFVRAQLVTAVATSDSAVLVLGYYPTYGPASNFDLASVDEIVA